MNCSLFKYINGSLNQLKANYDLIFVPVLGISLETDFKNSHIPKLHIRLGWKSYNFWEVWREFKFQRL